MAHGSAGSANGSTESPLFQPYKIGEFQFSSRIVYAPLTRCRGTGNIAQPAAVRYYSERAHGGLMVTEGTNTSLISRGYPNVPGIWTDEQVEAWKPVVKAVKAKDTTFFMQLWHVGRSSHSVYQPDNQPPIGPSAVAIRPNGGEATLPDGSSAAYPVPRALELEEIPKITDEFVHAAKNAIKAGFDGVEVHGANGYILDQFLKRTANKREDKYGGSIENRARLLVDTVKAVVEAVGPNKVGVRLSPYAINFNDSREPDTQSTIDLNVYIMEQFNKLPLAYVHIVTARAEGNDDVDDAGLEQKNLKPFRKAYKGTIIAAGGYVKENAEEELNSGNADLICYGRWFLSNPDFPERLRNNKPFNKYNRNTFYIPDQVKGYTDYPFLKDVPEGTPTEKHYSGATVFVPADKNSDKGPEPQL